MNSGKPTLFVRLTVKLCRKINYSGDKYSYHWSRSLRKAFFGIYRDTRFHQKSCRKPELACDEVGGFSYSLFLRNLFYSRRSSFNYFPM